MSSPDFSKFQFVFKFLRLDEFSKNLAVSYPEIQKLAFKLVLDEFSKNDAVSSPDFLETFNFKLQNLCHVTGDVWLSTMSRCSNPPSIHIT